MNELKYVIVIPPGFNIFNGARAIIFNGMMTHSKVVEEGFKVHSAGFCKLALNKEKGKMQIKCFGESISLNKKSDPIFDQMIIARTLTGTHPLIGFVD